MAVVNQSFKDNFETHNKSLAVTPYLRAGIPLWEAKQKGDGQYMDTRGSFNSYLSPSSDIDAIIGNCCSVHSSVLTVVILRALMGIRAAQATLEVGHYCGTMGQLYFQRCFHRVCLWSHTVNTIHL